MKTTTNSKPSSIAVSPILQRVFIVAVLTAFLADVVQVATEFISEPYTYVSTEALFGYWANRIVLPVAFFVMAYIAIKHRAYEARLFNALLLSVVGVAIYTTTAYLLAYFYQYMIGLNNSPHYYAWVVAGVALGLYAVVLQALTNNKSL
ncbi:MAG TPA: hypothetical protein VLE73_02870 [Candidatus Saccharimonadales bacterium]|nr:hypothetical protein [Candidatus Saccharimonadales bacterium]